MLGILGDCPTAATFLVTFCLSLRDRVVARVSALMSSVGVEYPTEQQVEALVAKVRECRGCYRIAKLKE